MMIFTYFPHDVIVQNAEPEVFSGLINQSELIYHSGSIRPEQIFVIINDLCCIQPTWASFLDNVKPLLGTAKIPEQFIEPVPVQKLITNIPNLFAGLVSEEIYQYISNRLWVDNKQIKVMFLKKASKKILHPEFTSRTSAYFNDLFESTMDFINSRASALRDHINKGSLKLMVKGFISGLDAGLMNTMINEEEPIKHKRIAVILDFIKDVQAAMFEKMNSELNVVSREYVEWAWRSRLALDNIDRSPAELLAMASNHTGSEQKSLVYYILIRSHTNDKNCVKWVEENGVRFLCSRFSPLS